MKARKNPSKSPLSMSPPGGGAVVGVWVCAWRLQIGRKLFDRSFRQAPVGRDLAAEHRKERRAPRRRIEIENIIARRGGRILGPSS